MIVAYLAHLARALTMREAQLDRLPAVDAGLTYLNEFWNGDDPGYQ